MTLSNNRPHHSRRCYFVQQRPLLFNLALLAGSRCHTGDPEHLDDVHEGIGQPGDDREPTSV